MKKCGTRTGPSSFFAAVEEQARHHRVRVLPLVGKSCKTTGLALLANDLAPDEAQEVLHTLAARLGQGTPDSEPVGGRKASQTSFLPQPVFLQMLTSEIERVRQTRLPCALLLVEVDAEAQGTSGAALAEHCGKALRREISQMALLGQLDSHLFSVALPATSLGKALRRADHLRRRSKSSPCTGMAGKLSPRPPSASASATPTTPCRPRIFWNNRPGNWTGPEKKAMPPSAMSRPTPKTMAARSRWRNAPGFSAS